MITGTGVELQGARQQMIIAARAAGVQCWDTVFTNLDAMDVFEEEVKMIKMMGFDGKSLVNPRQIAIVHKVFTPSEKRSSLRRRLSARSMTRRQRESESSPLTER